MQAVEFEANTGSSMQLVFHLFNFETFNVKP
jgi:hypothetical protein